MVGTVHDITDRKRAETEREQLIRELEAKNTELERFTYTVSHDLKAPLITIRGFLGYKETDALTGNMERFKSALGCIIDATERTQRLLGEILELSRIRRMMNPPQELPLEEIAQEALELVHGQIEARGVRVQMDPGLPIVYGNQACLAEIVQNLLDNACKFMGDQSERCQPRLVTGFDYPHNRSPVLDIHPLP